MELTKKIINSVFILAGETPIPFFFLAEAVGVPRTIWFRWMANGSSELINNKESLHTDLFKRVRAKEYEWVRSLSEKVYAGDKGDFKWLLERMWPDVFFDTKNMVAQFAAINDRIESRLATTSLPAETALANCNDNAAKFDYKINKGTNCEEVE